MLVGEAGSGRSGSGRRNARSVAVALAVSCWLVVPAVADELSGTIHVVAPTGPGLEQLKGDAAACSAKWPGTTIEVSLAGEITAANDYNQKLPDLLRSGDVDVAWFQHQNTFAAVQAAGVLAQIDDIWDEVGSALPPVYRQLWTDPDGHQHGIVNGIVWLPLIYYNKAQFKQAGVAPPENGVYYKSNDELFAAIDKLKAAGFGGLTITGNAPYWFDHQLSGLANNLLTGDEFVGLMTNSTPGQEPKIKWDDPRVVHVFEVQKEYLQRGIYADGFLARDYDQSQAQFYTGKASMMSDGSGVVPNFAKSAPDLDVGWMLYPQQRDDITPTFPVSGSNGIVISATTKNMPLAKAFVSCVVSQERQGATALIVSARTDLTPAQLAVQPPLIQDMLSRFSSVGVGRWWQDMVALPVTKVVDESLSDLMIDRVEPAAIGAAAEEAAQEIRSGN